MTYYTCFHFVATVRIVLGQIKRHQLSFGYRFIAVVTCNTCQAGWLFLPPGIISVTLRAVPHVLREYDRRGDSGYFERLVKVMAKVDPVNPAGKRRRAESPVGIVPSGLAGQLVLIVVAVLANIRIEGIGTMHLRIAVAIGTVGANQLILGFRAHLEVKNPYATWAVYKPSLDEHGVRTGIEAIDIGKLISDVRCRTRNTGICFIWIGSQAQVVVDVRT